MRDALIRFRYRYWPDHLLGEILSKRWTETAIPVIVLLIVGFALSRTINNFLSLASLADIARQASEIGFIALGMALVVIVGGIDLSVGSMFALTDFCALYTLDVLGWPVPFVILATIVCGALLGAVNGVLIGYLRLRAFITTLITLIIYRSRVRPADSGSLQRNRRRVPRFPVLEFHRRRRCVRRAERRARLRRGRDLRPHFPDAVASGLARDRDRRLAPIGL